LIPYLADWGKSKFSKGVAALMKRVFAILATLAAMFLAAGAHAKF
jgi:hypothetical protein